MQARKRVREQKRPGRPNAGSAKGSEALLQAAQNIFAIYGYEGSEPEENIPGSGSQRGFGFASLWFKVGTLGGSD